MTALQRASATLVATLIAGASQAGTVQVGVDVTKDWLSYATVFEVPSAPGAVRGAFVYGQFYAPGFYATPPGAVVGSLVELRPNTTLAPADTDTSHPFFSDWWQDDGAGGMVANKIVQDGFYLQDDALAGDTIVFTGFTVANTLALPYGASARAYIVDTYGDDYIFHAIAYTPLVVGQPFSVDLSVPAGHHVGYGIEVTGPNARAADLAGLGVLQVAAVPEPATVALFSIGVLAVLARRHRLGPCRLAGGQPA